MPHVTFIHGIANKPAPDKLLEMWRRHLELENGINLATKGITSSMIYWADVLYAEPAKDEDRHESVGSEDIVHEDDDNLDWITRLKGEELKIVEKMKKRLNFEAESPEDDEYEPPINDDPGFERIPLPWCIKRRLMKVLLRDVHHYLFNAESNPRPGEIYRVQDEIRNRTVNQLKKDAELNAERGGGPHILVSHSMGTVIAYDCLKRVPNCPSVDAVMTIGSPLGIDEVQDKLKPDWTRNDGFPKPKLKGGWANVYDRLDPVAFDANLANDFKVNGDKVILDQRQRNSGKWRHSIDKYLVKDELRQHLANQLGINWP